MEGAGPLLKGLGRNIARVLRPARLAERGLHVVARGCGRQHGSGDQECTGQADGRRARISWRLLPSGSANAS